MVLNIFCTLLIVYPITLFAYIFPVLVLMVHHYNAYHLTT